jgi:hypothetical protein
MNRRDPGMRDRDVNAAAAPDRVIGVPGWFDLHLETNRHSDDACSDASRSHSIAEMSA